MKSIRLFITAALLSLMRGTGEGVTIIYRQQSTKISGAVQACVQLPHQKLLKCNAKIHVAVRVVVIAAATIKQTLMLVDFQCKLLDGEGHVAGRGVQRLAAKGHVAQVRVVLGTTGDVRQALYQWCYAAHKGGYVALGNPRKDHLALLVGAVVEVEGCAVH